MKTRKLLNSIDDDFYKNIQSKMRTENRNKYTPEHIYARKMETNKEQFNGTFTKFKQKN